MYDIHCHILPKIDDGSKSIDDSIEMAKIAEESGIKIIIATPHYIEEADYKDYRYTKGVLNILNREIKDRGININILIGNEIFITPNIFKLLEERKITTLNQSRYILIELPTYSIPIFLEDLVYRILLQGMTPIIAHPNRNTKIIEDPNILYKLIIRGALAQIDFASIIGKQGEQVKNITNILLQHNMVHFVSTDAHSPTDLYLKLNTGMQTLSKILEEDKIIELLNTNPLAVIENKPIKIEKPNQYKQKSKFSFYKKLSQS